MPDNYSFSEWPEFADSPEQAYSYGRNDYGFYDEPEYPTCIFYMNGWSDKEMEQN